MRAVGDLDSRIFTQSEAEFKVAFSPWRSTISSLNSCGCSSVVERLLAKEDVASSTLVTR